MYFLWRFERTFFTFIFLKPIIKAHNNKVLGKNIQTREQTERINNCNCQDKRKCPIPQKCQTKTVIYKATVSTTSSEKTYIGSTEKTFKDRYYAHKTSITDENYKNSTTLSTHFWQCKEKGETLQIKWEIIKKCRPYKPGSNKCDVCLTEKMMILRERGPNSLNRRSELMYKCPHRSKWKLLNVKECE